MTMNLSGATVLITGGTGSFGSTMAAALLAEGVAQVRILSRDEAKQDDLRRRLRDERMRFYVGDVRDLNSVEDATRGVDKVFHAAALKQVPSCEFFPSQAVLTNVTGSHNVIEAAHRYGVGSVVLLSTDKAVYPINAMGMTKALMEKTAQAFARNNPESETVVSVVRYGNVLHSRGSVVPLFLEQLHAGRAMTITNPSMTRFLMSLQQSVDLVRHALQHAEPGDLFVRKAPAATIDALATGVAQLAGYEPRTSLIGTRHGEKLFETLLSSEELLRAEDHGAYYRVPLDARSLNYGLFFEEGETHQTPDDYTSHNTEQLDADGVVRLLRSVPEVMAALSDDERNRQERSLSAVSAGYGASA
ncbi:MAG: UDP-N-acetylglucosamine 4,6-dehydratase/5-epimerase [Acidimicrobiia bacterium]|jgi:UDP-glucose 4-epimerase|nr:UDP-N-acetylglucosamine 4,6-dehydratase/5-epimerase [Acidimicrobiia bacterium]